MKNKDADEAKKTYICGECGAEFGNRSDLRRHVLVAHPDEALEEEVSKDELLCRLHNFVKWNLHRGVVVAWYLGGFNDLQEDWRKAFGGDADIDMKEFTDGLERLKNVYRRFGRHLDYAVYRDEDVEEVAVAFDRPEEYDELWSEDGCVLATPLCGIWVVLNFCERRIDTISDVIREYSGGKLFAAAKLFAEDPGR
jgi:hypothetical protein